MTSLSRKRKSRPYEAQTHEQPPVSHQPDTVLFIQAYEADIIRGPQATAAAKSLEFRAAGEGDQPGDVGDGLILWGSRVELPAYDVSSNESMTWSQRSDGAPSDRSEGRGLWVDRYDARLLLESLPNISSQPEAISRASSPGGWSDLPSDAEDTFFFTAEETEDYRRDKRRRVMDRDREARLRAIRAEDGSDEERDPKESWGGSDEEPDDAQRELMRRTASHILSSPNPAQLEMRILANHGADPRFAFLRGRWSRAWQLAKGKVRLEQEEEKKRRAAQAKTQNLIGGLAGYGDSDEGSEAAEEEYQEDVGAVPLESRGTAEVAGSSEVPSEADDAVKAARRARAREWAEKRRAAKEAADARYSES
ncbi:hypothetical protein DICSQDRAFT_180388 [Dichomitus squalens LYAD-421 SS1]|uniref:SURP motif domain-containing protein n=1 Tax=Dichomitus squalens (strain LYAD-421) TaxID=732165 RepID=R7T248_DICSQ|nr:uncharacterized protein DICSQDRAFT_180388 [Dichomitus squalens LYAD-421 SS1]EJF62065.1 hypothetical protein DICSQDRAFT_180388 [Dichomitus squalens LYAD-421 SS1]